MKRFILIHSLFLSILVSSCSVFFNLITHYDYKKMETGFCLASYNDEVVIGSACTDNPAGMITILRKEGSLWTVKQVIDMQDFAYKKRCPMNFALNDKYLVAGLDNMTGKPGVIIVFRKKEGKWEKAFIINSPLKENDDLFGYSLAIFEDKLLVGTEAGKNGGKAYLYKLCEDNFHLDKIFYPPEMDLNRKFGRLVLMGAEYIVISDPWIYHELDNEKNGVHGTVYIYDRKTFRLVNIINNAKIAEGTYYSWLGTKGILDESNLFLTIRGERKVKFFNLQNENICNNRSQNIVNLNYDPVGSLSYWGETGVDFFGNNLVCGNTIYNMKDGILTKRDELSGYPIECVHLKGNLLVYSTSEHDNQAERREQREKLEEHNKKTYGLPEPEVEKPLNMGRVHIVRLLPEKGYEEEAIIARRTNPEGKIEFYDMLHDED